MKDIINSKYAITEDGQVYSYLRKKYLKQEVLKNGYARVELAGKKYLVHRLVAEAYLPNPDNLPCVNHKDYNRQNNSVDNLEWCSYEYNNSYSSCVEAMANARKKRVRQLTLNGEEVAIWDSAAEAGRKLGICNVYQAANGSRKSAGGFRWEYVIGGN